MNDDLCKMSDLVTATGVTKQTIHFYLREGLLMPPVKTSRNMAYYNPATIDDIRFIKELQEKRHLPLAIIKNIIAARRNGLDFAMPDHLDAFEDLFRQTENDAEHSNCEEFERVTGLSSEVCEDLINWGVFSPKTQDGELLFDSHDSSLGKELRQLLEFGVRPHDLALYADYLEWSCREANLLHERVIHQSGRQDHPPIRDVNKVIGKVKALITAKVYRELLLSHRQDGGEDNDI